MAKAQKCLLNIFTLLLLNTAFFICNIYPRHILEICDGAEVSIIINVIFSVVFYGFLIIVFFNNKTLFSDKPFNKSCAKKLPLLLIIQLAFDGLFIALGTIDVKPESVVTGVLIAIQWLIVYAVIAPKENNIFKNRKALTVVLVGVAAIALTGVIFDELIFSDYVAAKQKYTPQSEILAAFQTNAVFFGTVKLALTDTLAGALLICAHACISSDSSEKKKKVSVEIIRVGVLVALALALTFTKVHFWPYRAIESADSHSSTKTNFEALGKFDVKTENTAIYRYSMGICYNSNNALVYKDECTPASVQLPVLPYTYKFRAEGGTVVSESTQFVKYSVGASTAYLYNSSVICFYEDGVPCALSLDNLSDFKRNDTVIEVCRQTLENGNIFIFEYCRDYLLKHDKDFIEEYITRYSKGDFTQTEKDWMTLNNYREDFVAALATQGE